MEEDKPVTITDDQPTFDRNKSEKMVTAESGSFRFTEGKNTQQQTTVNGGKGQQLAHLSKQNKELLNEIAMIKDEKCVLINRIFALSKKYELMKTVLDSKLKFNLLAKFCSCLAAQF